MPAALRKEQLADLDQAFGLTRSGNAEVADSWFLLVIRNGYQPSYPRLEEYLKTVGRRKLIAPLYEELMKTPAGAAMAKRVYALARPGYHPQTAAAIDRSSILLPRRKMTSEWMKVMLEEIARKKADAEQAQMERSAAAKIEGAQSPPQPRRQYQRGPRLARRRSSRRGCAKVRARSLLKGNYSVTPISLGLAYKKNEALTRPLRAWARRVRRSSAARCAAPSTGRFFSSSFAEFQHIFGGLWQPSPLGYAVEHFFDNGGREALVVRVVNGARSATLTLSAGERQADAAGGESGNAGISSRQRRL